MSTWHKWILVFVIAALTLSACDAAPAGSNTADSLTAAPVQEAPTNDPAKKAEPAKKTTLTPTVEITPMPHPTPTMGGVERFSLLVSAFETYGADHKSEITSDESMHSVWDKFQDYKLQFGTSSITIKGLVKSFSPEDRTDIRKAMDAFEKTGGGTLGTIIALRGCKTNCKTIFMALWYACAHLALGENWFIIPESNMSNHPDPVLCGRSFNWEYLVDILDNDCPRYRVQWLGNGVKVTELQKKSNTTYEFSFDPGVAPLVISATALTIVGVMIIAPETAPILVPILLVAP